MNSTEPDKKPTGTESIGRQTDCRIAPQCAADMSAMGLASFDDFMNFSGGQDLVKSNMASYRRRVRLTAPSGNVYFLKTYNRPPLRIQWKNWVGHLRRLSIADADAGPCETLAAVNIKTPKVAAIGTRWGMLFEKQSFIITCEVGPDAESLERRLPDCFQGNAADKDVRNARRQFIEAVADLAGRFHATGYRHRDFYLAHIFWSPKAGFWLIDLARAFRPILAQRYRIKDIAQLFYSAPASKFSRADRLRFYMTYAGIESLGPGDKRFIRRVIAKADRIAAHDRKHNRTIPFIEG